MSPARLPPLAVTVRPFEDSDWPAVWSFLGPTIAKGDTYAYPVDSSEEELRDAWTRGENVAYVAEVAGTPGAGELPAETAIVAGTPVALDPPAETAIVAGTPVALDPPAETVVGLFRIKPNQPGQGSHVANGSYVTSPLARGRGVGRRLCEESQRVARERGFRAMQFNLVAATNVGAHALWTSCGFATLATLPGAFRTPEGTFVDAHVMYKTLI